MSNSLLFYKSDGINSNRINDIKYKKISSNDANGTINYTYILGDLGADSLYNNTGELIDKKHGFVGIQINSDNGLSQKFIIEKFPTISNDGTIISENTAKLTEDTDKAVVSGGSKKKYNKSKKYKKNSKKNKTFKE